MINARLVWYLEINNLISPVQSGFRSERSTNDNLVRLETFIRDAFVIKEHVVAVFFYLEKAYVTTWKYGICFFKWQTLWNETPFNKLKEIEPIINR